MLASQTTATMTEPLTKVDSAVQGLSSSPPKEKRRQSSSVPGVYNVADLGTCRQLMRPLMSDVTFGANPYGLQKRKASSSNSR